MSVRMAATFGALVAFGFSATAAFAEYQHCYIGAPPDDAQKSPPSLAMKAYGLEYGMISVLTRKACNLTNEHDLAHVRALYGHVGCTPESEVARHLEDILFAEPITLEGFEGLDEIADRFPGIFAEYCHLVAERQWPEVDQDFNSLPFDRVHQREVRRAMERLNERAREASPKLGR